MGYGLWKTILTETKSSETAVVSRLEGVPTLAREVRVESGFSRNLWRSSECAVCVCLATVTTSPASQYGEVCTSIVTVWMTYDRDFV